MKEKLLTLCWALKLSFTISPARFIINFVITILTSLIPVYLAVFVGDSLNTIQETISNNGSINDLMITLIWLGIILVLDTFFFYGSGIITSAVNVKTTTKIDEKFIQVIRNIPIINFDDSNFCDKFQIAQDGFKSIITTVDSITFFISEVIALVVSIGVIFQASYYILIFVIISFIAGYKINMLSKKVQYTYWKESTKKRRLSAYLAGIFFQNLMPKKYDPLICSPFYLKNGINLPVSSVRIHTILEKNRIHYLLIINFLWIFLT